MTDNMLIFRTASFKAEKGSILHTGIFSRELASFLAAGAVMTVLGFFFAYRYEISAIHFIAAVVLFALLSMLFRSYVFYEANLEVVFDKDKGLITSALKKAVSRETNVYPISDLTGIKPGLIVFKPENPDGVKVVESIALQHGTVIPGFGEATEFNTVEMAFKNRKPVMLFATEIKEEAERVIDKIKKFLEG